MVPLRTSVKAVASLLPTSLRAEPRGLIIASEALRHFLPPPSAPFLFCLALPLPPARALLAHCPPDPFSIVPSLSLCHRGSFQPGMLFPDHRYEVTSASGCTPRAPCPCFVFSVGLAPFVCSRTYTSQGSFPHGSVLSSQIRAWHKPAHTKHLGGC